MIVGELVRGGVTSSAWRRVEERAARARRRTTPATAPPRRVPVAGDVRVFTRLAIGKGSESSAVITPRARRRRELLAGRRRGARGTPARRCCSSPQIDRRNSATRAPAKPSTRPKFSAVCEVRGGSPAPRATASPRACTPPPPPPPLRHLHGDRPGPVHVNCQFRDPLGPVAARSTPPRAYYDARNMRARRRRRVSGGNVERGVARSTATRVARSSTATDRPRVTASSANSPRGSIREARKGSSSRRGWTRTDAPSPPRTSPRRSGWAVVADAASGVRVRGRAAAGRATRRLRPRRLRPWRRRLGRPRPPGARTWWTART